MLVDPMCGSGTFLIEAALMATNAAPGLLRRRWPFERWPDFEPAAWQRARAAAAAARDLEWDGQLLGNDVHDGALSLAVRCARVAFSEMCPVYDHMIVGGRVSHGCFHVRAATGCQAQRCTRTYTSVQFERRRLLAHHLACR